MTMPLNF